MHRRAFVQSLALAATLPRAVFAQSAPSATKLADSLTLITGAGNNVLSLAGDGALLVDCGDAAHAQDVLRLAGGNVATVINTHWHLESTGANDAIAQSGAKLVSNISTKLWMTQDIYHDWEKKTYPKRAVAAQPTQTFYETQKLTANGETIEMGLLPMAHTDGDIYVKFPKANVIAAGDVLQPSRLPALDWFCGGWIGGMQNGLRTLIGLGDDNTKYVPASGPVMTKAQVQAHLDTITKVREQLVKVMKQGKGAQDMIDMKAVAEFQPQLAGDPSIFLYTAYRGLWAHVRELGGIV